MAKHRINIIHEDDDIIVANKPPFLPVTRDRSGSAGLIDLLMDKSGSRADLRPVHYISKDASGLVIIAKNYNAQSSLTSAYEKQKINQTFLAIVAGRPLKTKGTINYRLTQNKNDPRKMTTHKRGNQAKTNYQLLADFSGLSLLAVTPVTHRTHQTRVHLAKEGFGLAIDPLYTNTSPIMLSSYKLDYRPSRKKQEPALIDRLTLHCYQMQLTHPDGSNQIFVANLEKKFAAAVKMLTKYNPRQNDCFIDPEIYEKIIAADVL